MGVENLRDKLGEVRDTLSRYIVGNESLINLLLVAAASGGHILVDGPPGAGKTVTLKLFARLIGGVFKRIQMTADTLPSDLLGTFYYDIAKSSWIFREGPIFANIVLIDEVSRAPPRTLSALLEVMQERQATIEGYTKETPKPFLVVATKALRGEEGVYPLPFYVIDRFAYNHSVGYLSPKEESEILVRADYIEEANPNPIMSPEEVSKLQAMVRGSVYVSDKVRDYIVNLVNYIRGREEVLFKLSPRASIWLMRGSRVLAFLEGLDYVAPDHVKALAYHVLRHRVILKREYELEGVTADDIIGTALKEVEVPKL
ncbi:MAG: MoxR family ATPase [Sulfolobales archaeon]